MAAESPGRNFGRADRLRKSREFQDVSRRGRRTTSPSFVLLVAPRAGGAETAARAQGRIGLTVSRRVGRAVVRNRVKRGLREWFRQSGSRMAGAFDWVVIARPGAASLAGEALRVELDALSSRALAGLDR